MIVKIFQRNKIYNSSTIHIVHQSINQNCDLQQIYFFPIQLPTELLLASLVSFLACILTKVMSLSLIFRVELSLYPAIVWE